MCEIYKIMLNFNLPFLDDSIEGRSPRPSKFSEFKRLLSKSTSVELGKVLSTHESKSGERGTDFYRIGRSTMV